MVTVLIAEITSSSVLSASLLIAAIAVAVVFVGAAVLSHEVDQRVVVLINRGLPLFERRK